MMLLALALALASPGATPQPADEARVSLDARQTDVKEVLTALARLGRLQVVFDPDVSCQLTVKVDEARWSSVVDAALGACGLGAEGEGSILRVASTKKLAAEAASRRRLAEAKAAVLPRAMTRFRLSYARAQELAPLLEKILAPGSDVVYDERTNTLILVTGS